MCGNFRLYHGTASYLYLNIYLECLTICVESEEMLVFLDDDLRLYKEPLTPES